MGTIQGEILGPARARHLLQRTGFGATKSDVDAFAILEAGVAVESLLAFRPSRFQPGGPGRDFGEAVRRQHNVWVRYMLRGRAADGLREKLVLFWHDHFATGISKVGDTKLMGIQNKLLREHCRGDMRALVKAINLDPAMINWLDTRFNHKAVPNENYARELQELFTLGVFDLDGAPNYTQADIVQIARAFTGWSYDDRRKTPTFNFYDHDTNAEYLAERGPKAIYASSGGFGGGRNYTQYPVALDDSDEEQAKHEIDNVIDIIFEHKDSAGKSTVARRTARRLLEYFAHGGFANPDPATVEGTALIQVIDDVISRSGFDTSWNIGQLVREILLDDELYASVNDPANAIVGDATKKSIKWPVDFVISTLRVLRVGLAGRDFVVPGDAYKSVYDHLENMGQTLLDPPSVFGWDWEAAWVSSQTLLARYGFARDVISARDKGGLVPAKLMDTGQSDPGEIVDAVTEVLGVKDDLSGGERDALIAYLGGPGAVLDLDDYDTRNRKLHGLIGLVVESPAYQLH